MLYWRLCLVGLAVVFGSSALTSYRPLSTATLSSDTPAAPEVPVLPPPDVGPVKGHFAPTIRQSTSTAAVPEIKIVVPDNWISGTVSEHDYLLTSPDSSVHCAIKQDASFPQALTQREFFVYDKDLDTETFQTSLVAAIKQVAMSRGLDIDPKVELTANATEQRIDALPWKQVNVLNILVKTTVSIQGVTKSIDQHRVSFVGTDGHLIARIDCIEQQPGSLYFDDAISLVRSANWDSTH